MKKFNLSFKHLLVRFSLVIFLTIIFGLAMLPFLRTADSLFYSQKAAIGAENLWRIVGLWGLFTIITLLITFWKKRFRLTAVILIFFWIFGTILVIFISIAPNKSCARSSSYPLDPEINRSLDLIAQRSDIENNYGTYLGKAFDYRNCLDIQYSDQIPDDAEGVFLESDSTLEDLKILLSPEYKNFDDLTLSTLLAHELTHVGQYIEKNVNDKVVGCYESEAEAFTVQAVFINQLNDEERRSIYARINEFPDLNPQFPIILGIDKNTNDSYNACTSLRQSNNLTDQQFNECVWQGTQNKILEDVQDSSGYQKQCMSNQ